MFTLIFSDNVNNDIISSIHYIKNKLEAPMAAKNHYEELLKTYKVLRGFNISFQAYDKTAIRDGLVFSRSIDNRFFIRDDDFKSTIDIMLRTVKFTEKGLVLPLSSHIISGNAEWGISPHRLEYVLKTAADLLLKFYRYRDF